MINVANRTSGIGKVMFLLDKAFLSSTSTYYNKYDNKCKSRTTENDDDIPFS